MTNHYNVIIIGAGHAGAQAAISLRQQGFGGSVLLIGDENILPYDRPSLSKAYMLGSIGIERMLLRDAYYWRDQKIEVSLSSSVVEIDAAGALLRLGDGRSIGFGDCIIATGGALRTLSCPGATLPGVHGVRDMRDVDAIRADLQPGMSVLIAGAGYVGLEAAAVLRTLDHSVTVIEAQERVLARVAGPALSHHVEMTHRSHGVDFRLGQQLVRIEGDRRIEHAVLASGERLAADLMIVGIGISPRTGLAERAGLHCEDGVMVDNAGRTSAPHIYAIGDCARHFNSYANDYCRLESVQHANASAEIVADAIMGGSRTNDAVPTFWSDQYDLRIQSAGLASPDADCIRRGADGSDSFSLLYVRDGRVIALDAVNCPKDFMAGRGLVQRRAAIDPARLADTSMPLKQIAAEFTA